MDSAARRLYISRGTRVMVWDVDSGTVAGEIPGTNGVHGIALASDLGKGFTSNGRDATSTIFDLKTLKVLGQAKTGTGPDAIIYDPATQRVFTLNGGSKDATAIDAKSGEVAGTVALGGRPEFAAADGRGMVFVNLEDKSAVVAIDSKSLKVKATWPLAPGEEPSGMAIDAAHHRLFIGCHNKMMAIMDSDNGKVVATPPIGAGVDANGFDPDTELAFSSNGDGTLTVVHEDSPDKFTVVENASTAPRARTMAVDLKNHNVYLVTAEFLPAPAPTTENPHPRPPMKPGSFMVVVMGR
jgi:DNA-binding beta-propeller fold protein YncE